MQSKLTYCVIWKLFKLVSVHFLGWQHYFFFKCKVCAVQGQKKLLLEMLGKEAHVTCKYVECNAGDIFAFNERMTASVQSVDCVHNQINTTQLCTQTRDKKASISSTVDI